MQAIKLKGKPVLSKRAIMRSGAQPEGIIARGIASAVRKPKVAKEKVERKVDDEAIDALQDAIDKSAFDVWVGYEGGDVYIVPANNAYVVVNVPTKGGLKILATTKDQSDKAYVSAIRIIADWIGE